MELPLEPVVGHTGFLDAWWWPQEVCRRQVGDLVGGRPPPIGSGSCRIGNGGARHVWGWIGNLSDGSAIPGSLRRARGPPPNPPIPWWRAFLVSVYKDWIVVDIGERWRKVLART